MLSKGLSRDSPYARFSIPNFNTNTENRENRADLILPVLYERHILHHDHEHDKAVGNGKAMPPHSKGRVSEDSIQVSLEHVLIVHVNICTFSLVLARLVARIGVASVRMR